MNKLSTKMKRMLAVLLVEVIVATNVVTSYASSADEPFTMTEEEAADAHAEEVSEEPAEEVVAAPEEEPIVEEPVVEEPVVEEVVEAPVEEPVQEPVAEQPVEEVTEQPPAEEAQQPAEEVPAAETPEEAPAEEIPVEEESATEAPTEETVVEETEIPTEEVTDAEELCVCTEECTADEFDEECPVCAALADMEDADAITTYLEENCLIVIERLEAEAEAEVEATVAPEEEEEATEAEVTEVDNSVVVTGICTVDGEAIAGAENFVIAVDGVVTLADEAPEVEGYAFTDSVTLENGDAITQIKKEVTEEETEDGIVKTTSMSYTAGADWVELTEDVTVVFEYTLDDEAVAEKTETVKFVASYVDTEGNAIEGYTEEVLSFENSMDLTMAPTTIENYTYIEAKINDTVATSLNKKVETVEEEEVVAYSYTADGTEVEVTEDTTVTFVYEAVAKEVVIAFECVDEEGNALEGYESLPMPSFEEELVLDDAEKAPYTIMDYTFVEADVDGAVITSLLKEVDEETADATYSYVTADGETVVVEEDVVITLNYEAEEVVVEVKASIVDSFGEPIDEKYTDLDMDELFGDEEVLVLDDLENPPVDKVQVRQSLFKVIKYTYVDATVGSEVIASLKREATKDTAELDEKEYIYSYTTDGSTWTKMKEDATVIFEYSDGKKSVYTYEDGSVLVTATLQHANAIPDDAQFVVTPITPKSGDYNYDAYMEALNKGEEKTADGKAKYNEENTLLYDIAFLAQPVDEEGNTIEGELVEYQPAEGMVNISIVFKKNQISDDLSADKAQDVTVTHLPLKDSVKEQVSTTAEATDISASDVKVEKIDDASVALDKSGKDKISFSASDFSTYSVSAVDLNVNTSSDTFLTNGGEYTLEYILNNFQIVTLNGDLQLVNHCMGAILVNGNQTPQWVGFADDVNTAKKVSSYIKGIYSGAVAGRASNSDAPEIKPLYIGTVNKAEYLNGQWVINGNYNSQMKTSAVYLTDNYVDWDAMSKALKGQSLSISAGCTDTVSAADANGSGWITINAGDSITIDDLSGISCINIIGNMTDAINTIINIPASGDVKLPEVRINGQYASVAEVASGTAVVWNLPNANGTVTVPSINWVGHIICPDAHVHVTGGNYNGGIICKSMETHGEGHVYPYNGGTIVPTTSGFKATKTIDGQTPGAGEVFTFKFDELVSGSWKNLATATNSGSTISFPSINYSDATQIGDHWYIVYEEQKTQEGYSLSTILYVVKDTVTSTTKSNVETYSATSTYYKVNGSENGWMDPASILSGSSIDMSKLTQISGEGAVVFDNSTAKTEISVTKSWNDNNNQDGIRPASVTVQLKSNGSNFGNVVTLSADNNWSYKWTGLPEKYNGNVINYTVEEVNVPNGYTSSVSGDATNGFVITNTHTTEKINISGTKTWDDSNNQDGKRPASITIRLLANGSEVKNVTVKPDASGNWKFTFKDLPKYAGGQLISYSITEDAVDGYTTTVTGSADAGFTVVNKHETTNINISGTKTWNDNDDQDGIRPDSITVRLLANGSEVKSSTVKPDASGNWSFAFTNLPEYANGNKITYTLTEDAVNGYTTKVNGDATNGFEVVNTHKPETTSVSGTKTWSDNNNSDNKRPASITIRLYADGTEVQSKTVSASDGWSWNFTELPKFNNGVAIKYTISEDAVEGYTTVVDGYNVTNTHKPETTSISGTKTWSDNDNQDGKRPASITINLLADGVEVDEKVVTEADGWKWNFTELPKYKTGSVGVEIVYTVTEDAVEEYTTTVNGYDVTNTHETEKTEVNGSKTWDDANNQDGKRPASITINLFADGTKIDSKNVTADDNWAWSFTGLDKYANGKEIVYTITEDAVAEYTTTVNGYDVTNSYTTEKTEVSGSKTWNDGDNRDNKRPDSITIKLLANGVEKDSVVVTEEDNWSWSFTGLDKYANGKEITYTIVEETVEGYTTTYDGYDVTNEYTPEETGMTVVKKWEDGNDQDGIRPDSVSVQLYADGEAYGKAVTLTAADGWTYTWTGLPKNAAGKTISYTVEEVGEVTGYTTAATSYEGTNATITNTHETETVEVSGKKTWNDNNNQDGIRPESIKINLHADGEIIDTVTVKAADWSWSFTDLPKNKNVDGESVEIVYTVTEEAVDGYTTTVNGYDVTNTHITEKVDVEGSKTWSDNNDQDGMRPESITVNLLADGVATGKSVTVTAADSWSWSFTGLDKFKAGKEIEYTVTEEAVEGYTATVNGYDITNTHTPEKVTVEGKKTWNDADNQDGKRPESITINLLADGVKVDSKTVTAESGWTWSFADLDKYANGNEIVYTITEDEVAEYTTSVTGYNVINTHIVEEIDVNGTKIWNDNNNQDGVRPTSVVIKLLADGKEIDTVTVSADDIDENGNWAWSFENLPKYKDGTIIEYTVTEATVEGYNPSVSGSVENGFTITNSHTPGETEISVKKIWNDADDQDGKRPGSIQVQLYAEVDGVKEAYGDAVTLSDGNSWSAGWKNLPEKEDGKTINYTVEEVASTIPEGYTASYTLDASGKLVTITNAYTPEKTSISGSKTWADENNQDGVRPQSITINLYAGDTLKESKNVTAPDWSWTFDNLDKYAGGTEIVYSIKEDAVEGYTTTYDGYNVTNTHEPEKTEVNGSKTWVDNDNQDGLRPASITVNLLADGTKVDSVTVTEKDNWSYSFADLDKYKDGKEIKYTITEEKVAEYTTEISGSDIVNTHTPGKTAYSVEKTWDDNNNQDGKRAASITVQLLANGEAVENGEAVLSDANNWKYTWTDLDEKKNGATIDYSVEEITATEGYTVSYSENDNGMIITNTHTPETISVSGSKTWVDNDDQDGARPDEITITLLGDGKTVATKTVTAADNWAWSFTNLPKYADGKEIVYTITESEVPGYKTEIDGFNVTNTHEPEKTQVSGSKLWNDANNQDGKRPESVIINLLANGTKVDSVEVKADADGNWNYAFTNLDKYADGEEIVYSVTEEEITTADYSATIDGFTITNSYTPDQTTHTVTKVWEDNNDQDGIRPDDIRVQLLADGKEQGAPVTLTASNGWTYTWNELTKYRDGGVEIKYTAVEVGEVDGYTIGEPVTANGITTITNTHETETVDISGSKTWADNDNQDGVRPTSITINLLADGVATGKTATVTAADGWAWSFTGLDKYKDGGKEITYTITEDAVENYTSEVNGYDVTNTHIPATTEISGSKVWDDADNQDGKRPTSITVNLLADNVATGKSVTVTEADDWKWSFTDLPKYKDGGKEIVYTVTEDTVADYTTVVDGYVITNSYTPGKTNHSVTKVWDDAENQDGKRPESIQVQLLADGKAQGSVVTLNATNSWSYTWDDLDLMSAGKEITYTVEEVEVPAGYKLTSNVTDGTNTTITNSYDTEETSVSGTKTWADENNQDGKRPASITINLLADGDVIDTKTVTEADGWAWTFDNLPKYKAGKEIVYTITEEAVANYETTVNGFNVTNTHEPEKTSVSGSKTWNDANNQDGVRPESIIINLHANGEVVASKEVTEADGWAWSFENLDKYEGGKEITYTVSEEKITTADYQSKVNGFDITNSYTPGKTNLTVTKVWDDSENQDGIRPDAVTVQLYADGVAVDGKTAQLNAANGWSASFDDLDEKKDGQIIEYTAKEVGTISGYVVSYENTSTTTTITNTHTPEETSVSGTKTWEDADNQDGKRPTSIIVNLLANGEKVASQVVSPDADGNWSYTFTKLPKKADGTDIVYTVTEEAVAGYTATVNGTNIVNTHEPEKTSVSGTKTWVGDEENLDARPESITINLFADDKQIDSKTVTAADNWAWSFTDLDKYADGKEIVYTITEDFVNGYSTDVKGYDVTNTYTPGFTSIEVTKTWNDNNDQDGKRPESITVQLYEKYLDWGLIEISGPKGDPITLSADNNWTYKWENLPVKKQGSDEVAYFVKEIGTITGYETEIINGTDIKITNTYETETTKVEGKKTWNDNNDQDGARPESITVRLYDGETEVDAKTVTAADDWKWSFTDLPKYKNGGTLIVYTVKEDVVIGYESVVDGYNVTNTHIPELTEYPVEKIWDDANNQDGVRPDTITVQLYANGEAVEGKTAVLNTENAWKATFEELDKYADGKLVVYTAQEVTTPDGYEKDEVHTAEGTTITNTHVPATVKVSGSKTWTDANNQDGVRPEKITIRLLANGIEAGVKEVTAQDGWAWSFENLPKYEAGVEITYTIEEDKVEGYTTEVTGFNVENTHEPAKTSLAGNKVWDDADNQDGVRPESIMVNLHANGEKVASKEVTEADGWAWSFTDLDKYEAGVEIKYTVSEDVVSKYSSVIEGTTITNSYTPGKTSLNVSKLWVDENDQDGLRPESIVVDLYADGKKVAGKSATLNEANGWAYTWTDLDEKKDGQTIVYTAKEAEAPAEYEVTYNNETTGTTIITNTHETEEIDITGKKTWADNDDQDGKRPESITIRLLADREEVKVATVTPDEAGNWTWSFTDLPKYKDHGTEIVYTITEDAVAGYETVVEGYNVTNTHEPEKVSVSGSKTWIDNNDAEGARPESITIRLFADSEEVDSVTVTPDEAGNWTWSFTDLDKYADGQEINYTVSEDKVVDYSTEVNGYDINNTYTPNTTQISVTKNWVDNDDQDGIRPDSITVQLMEKTTFFDKVRDEVTLDANNNWSYTWEGLPDEKKSEKVQYYVKEVKVDGYDTEINNGATNITITNTHETETTEVKGSKTWNDNNNQDGFRPTEIVIRLLADGEEVKSQTVTEAENWKWSFTELPKYRDGGVEIIYTITEDAVNEYTTEITGTAADGFEVINSHEEEKTEYKVVKEWADADDQDGLRPESIIVQLYANGEAVEGKTAVLNAENAWKATFEDLDKYADGKLIVYTAQEVTTPDGYEKNEAHTAEGTTITNTHVPATVEVSGSKTWTDADNQDGVRPEKITIRLLADGTEVGVKEVTATDNWAWSFTNLPKYEAGELITYTIEEDKVDGYTTVVSGFDVENTHEPAKTSLAGSKVWDDADNQDGIRPESITVNLHANGEKVASKEVTEADGWAWSFEDLDKYEAGVEIVYTVTEDVVPNYTTVIEGTTITNSYTPGKTSLNVSKIWADNNDQDGIRPESITVDLYADGKKVEGKSATLNEANGWAYTWTDLDEKKDGQKITYTAVEADEVEGYTTAYNNEVTGTTIITNTHETEEIDITGKKTWADNDDQDGKRPESIVIRLLADGEEVTNATVTPDEAGNWAWSFTDLPKYRDGGVEIVYTITEDAVADYETEVDGYNVTNTHEPEKVSLSGGKTWSDNADAENARPDSITIRLFADSVEVDSVTVTPDETGNWTWSFTDLDKYANGQEINYTVSEDKVVDYQSAVDGYNVNNTYNPGTTQISVTKNWVDNDDQDGIRPDSITVQLMEKTTFFDKVRDEVTLDESNNWSYTWTNLPDEKKSEKVQYYVKEVKVDGYETEINNGTTNITITNTHETETTEVKGSKTWNDNNNQDGKRPTEIVIRLLADGEEVMNQTVTPDEKGNWTWSFTELPKYRDGGVEIVYTITEDAIEEYSTEITGNAADGYEVINTDEIDKTEYKVEKKWADADNQDGIRPESITVQLYANGEAVEGKTAVLNTENAWKATFEDLDKYADGKLIVYTAQETAVPEGYTMTADHVADGLTVITNTHTPDVISVAGGKTWVDADNQDGVRPASITINLLANGVEVAEKTVTAADNWAWSFTNLPKNEAGKEIVYTITEDEVAEYTAEVDGFNVTNNHTPETVEVSGTKTWDDANNQDGKRPAEITITLNADGEPTEQVTVTESDNWTWTFTDLPKYKDGGKEIVYTVSEAAVAEYTTTYDGYNVTNSYTPGETGVTVTKAWDDANDQDGIRPDDIKVQLAADGVAYGDPVTLSADNNWTYTWTELPEMNQGKKIAYTVEEIMASDSGYTSITTGDAANGYTITNTHTPETVKVEGLKTWIDADNQDGKRPATITVNLLADGQLKESRNVTAADNWAWSFTDLPKYRDGGVEIVYTITENEVTDYVTEINGYDVENTHEPETVEVSGLKTWNDNENAEGVRPTEIIINLLADGQLVDSKTVTEADEWKWSFTNLDKYKDGVEIVYTITEEEVVDYSTTVNGYDVTNDYTPEETKITVTKVWDDADDQDGIRPASIKVQLYEGVFVRGDAVELNAENNWTYSWEHLPAKKFGLPVEYTVKEVDTIPGYTTEIIDGTSTTITNTHIPEVVEVEGKKTWDDADNQDGMRPESITINLYADGVLKDTKTVTEADDWKWSFTDLPKNKNVNGEVTEIVYTIEEVAVDEYETVMEEGSYDITNVHEPEVIDIEGTKTWDDADNQDGIRPTSITVRLYANGTEVDSKTVTAANDWKWTFTDLPKYSDGVEITYTITEDVVSDYSTTYDGYDVTNSYTPEKTSRTVVKVWDDQGNRDSLRPGSVVVQLYADGSAKGEPVILSKANSWSHTWTNLDVKKDGKEIVYTVVEVSKVDGYTTTYSEDTFTITNRHVPEDPTPTPNDPTPTPNNPTPTPNNPAPTPTPEGSVLGAKRVEDGMVLGARRGSDYAVLGKRRRPATGDSMEIFVWIMALAASMGGVVTSLIMMGSNKKKRK